MKIIIPYENSLEKRDINQKFPPQWGFINLLKKENYKKIHYFEAERKEKIVISESHPLIQAADTAFYNHLPLVLTPDVIWYTISNAVAIYVNKHAKVLRETFVNHEGKKELLVERLDFQLEKNSNWNEIIEEFVEKIKENTKTEFAEYMQTDFTTTSKISRVCSQIVIMDAMQQYFEYTFRCGCGIPEIRLSGEKSDWERVKIKANKLIEIIPKFKEWIEGCLNEVLDQFINAFDDKIDKEFWKSIHHSKSFYTIKLNFLNLTFDIKMRV